VKIFTLSMLALSCIAIANPPAKPNIIYILADDMGYSDLSCYGGEIETPSLDRLAAEGMRFRRFYNQAKCEPTRAALMTGLYHPRPGLDLSKPSATLAEALKTGGYRNYIVGKWHLPKNPTSSKQTPTSRGFHHFYGLYDGASSYFPSSIGPRTVSLDTAEPGEFVSPYDPSSFAPNWQDGTRYQLQNRFPDGYYMTDAFGDHAVASINHAVAHPGSAPFFLYLAFNAPHTPLQAPEPLIEKYRARYQAGWDQIRTEKLQQLREKGLLDANWPLPDWRDDVPRWNDLTEPQRQREAHRRAVYAAMIDSMDQNIGKILDRLDQLNIAKNTLIMFMSDNGAQAFDNTTPQQRKTDPSHPDSQWSMGSAWSSLSNLPFRYNKQSQHAGGNCSPLIARWPDVISPGITTDQAGHIIDLMPTFVEIGGADYPSLGKPKLDGASLLPIFKGNTRPAPDFWGFEFGRSDMAVIQGDWKLVCFRSSPWRLYHINNDRAEVNNLAWQFPDRVQSMAALYDQWARDVHGDASHIYQNRSTIQQLGPQHMRYTEVLKDPALGFYHNPPIHVGVANIGEASVSEVSEMHEVWKLRSSGNGMIHGTSDTLTLAHKSFQGDGEMVIRLESATSKGSLAKVRCGIMLRASPAPNSPFLMTGFNPANGQTLQIIRSTTGAIPEVKRGTSGIPTPVFLRLRREGSVFTSSYSTDQSVWKEIATTTVPEIPSTLLGGPVLASGASSATAQAIMREWEHLDSTTRK